MSNRVLTRADDNPGEILEDGELHKVGMWEEVTIERSAAGAPGLLFIITRYENGMTYDQMCVTVPDGAAFLAPVNAWLNCNDPQPWVWNDRGVEHRLSRTKPEWDVPPNHSPYIFAPRPGYNQNRSDYA